MSAIRSKQSLQSQRVTFTQQQQTRRRGAKEATKQAKLAAVMFAPAAPAKAQPRAQVSAAPLHLPAFGPPEPAVFEPTPAPGQRGMLGLAMTLLAVQASLNPESISPAQALAPPQPQPPEPAAVKASHVVRSSAGVDFRASACPDAPAPLRVCKGEPVRGRVTIYGQVHQDFFEPSTVKPAVVASQTLILRELLRTRPRTVFVEGYSAHEVFSPSAIGKSASSFDGTVLNRATARQLFGTWDTRSPLSAEQAKVLVKIGAADVYAYLCDDVTLRGVEDPEALARGGAALQAWHDGLKALTVAAAKVEEAVANVERGASTPAAAQLRPLMESVDQARAKKDKAKVAFLESALSAQRELPVVRTLTRFFEAHPGATDVALVFGAAHDFAQYCGKELHATVDFLDTGLTL